MLSSGHKDIISSGKIEACEAQSARMLRKLRINAKDLVPANQIKSGFEIPRLVIQRRYAIRC